MARYTLEVYLKGRDTGVVKMLTGVNNALTALTSSSGGIIGSLNTLADGVKRVGTEAQSAKNGIQGIGRAIKTTEANLGRAATNATNVANAFTHLGSAVRPLGSALGVISNQTKTVSTAFRSMITGASSTITALGRLGNVIRTAGNAVSGAGKAVRDFGSSAKKSSDDTNKFTSSLSGIIHVAAGVLLRDTIRAIYNAILDLGHSAVAAYENFELLIGGLETLATKQMMLGQTAQVASSYIYEATAADTAALQELNYEYELLGAKIIYIQEKLGEASEEFGAGSYQALTLAQDLRETQAAYEGVGAEIEALIGKNGQLVTVLEEVTVGQMSHSKAMEAAIPLAAGLAQWIEDLSLTRPMFSEEVTANTLKLAAAFGFTLIYASELSTETERLAQAQLDGVVTAQRLTLALQDFVAGSGYTGDYLERLITAFGQVQAKGKLAAEEIRQFVNAGLGIDTMARALGMTVGEFTAALEAGQILAEDFIPAVIKLLEQDFGGAAERFTDKLVGLKQGFENLIGILGRRIIAPFLEYLLPRISRLYRYFSSNEFRDRVSQWAEGIATEFRKFVEKVAGYFNKFGELFDKYRNGEIDLGTLTIRIRDLLFPEAVQKVEEAVSSFIDKFKPLQDIELGFQNNLEALKSFVKGIVIVLGSGAIVGVLTFIAGVIGAIASAVGWVGLAMALLYTAWDTNWMGIKDKLIAAYNKIKPTLEIIRTWFVEKIPVALEFLKKKFEEFKSKLIGAWSTAKVEIDKFIIAVQVLYNWLIASLPEAIETAKSYFNDKLVPAMQTAKDGAMGFLDMLKQLYTYITNDTDPSEILGYLQPFVDFFSAISLAAQSADEGSLTWLTESLEAVVDLADDLATNPLFGESNNGLLKDFSAFMTGVSTALEPVIPLISLYGSYLDWIADNMIILATSHFPEFWREELEIFKTTIEPITTLVNGMRTDMEDLAKTHFPPPPEADKYEIIKLVFENLLLVMRLVFTVAAGIVIAIANGFLAIGMVVGWVARKGFEYLADKVRDLYVIVITVATFLSIVFNKILGRTGEEAATGAIKIGQMDDSISGMYEHATALKTVLEAFGEYIRSELGTDISTAIKSFGMFQTNLMILKGILEDILGFLQDILGLAGQVGDIGELGGNSGGTSGGMGSSGGSGSGGGASAGNDAPLVGTMVVNNPAAAATVFQQLRNAQASRNLALLR